MQVPSDSLWKRKECPHYGSPDSIQQALLLHRIPMTDGEGVYQPVALLADGFEIHSDTEWRNANVMEDIHS